MKNAFLAGFILLIFSCTQKGKTPDSIIPPKKMEAVFWDIFRADELANQLKTSDSVKTALQHHAELYDQVFKLHNTSKEEFRKSFNYYQSRPDLLKPMLESLAKKSDKTVKQD